ncbi:esterase-like activity of phytase-domain-containing protein [Lipomyces japonicus]|uniref:esterase-like activity of phytase-domain-containing protein n=1 Tax=Lipomyces japonicus TaxID=56871 RepID=UPI0034CD70CE
MVAAINHVVWLILAVSALAHGLPGFFEKRTASSAAVNKTVCNGQTFSYDSLVAYGFLSGSSVDDYGDTISFGSSIAIDRPSIKVSAGKTNYSAVAYNLPDRGWNTQGTTNFQPRVYKFQLSFQPQLAGHFAPNAQWVLEDTIILKDPFGNPLTGLDCDTVLHFPGFPDIPAATYTGDGWGGKGGPASETKVCLDPESIVLVNGTGANGFWISDEYGPYMYRFNSEGLMVQAIRPVDALIPIRNGTQSFSADSPRLFFTESDDITPANPTSGRSNNQGFEGASVSPDGRYLYVFLQSAAVQDGGLDKTTNRYSRLFKYDISIIDKPVLVGEYVIPLPQYVDPTKSKKKNPRTAASSEIYALSETQFLVLARDSNFGHGQDSSESIYRHLDVYDISKATNIADIEKYNVINGAVAPDGVLDDAITPAEYCAFLDVNVNSQLGKFAFQNGEGLHNGGDQDWKLLNEKWEGIALIPADGKNGADGEFYVIIVSDDDFMTTHGFVNFGRNAYRDASGFNLDNQALIFKVTLPSGVAPFKYFSGGTN